MLTRLFLDHPHSVDETYLEHMRFALTFAFWLIVAGLAALAHAFVPAVCETTASGILRRLHARVTARAAAVQAAPEGATRAA
jgi:hypothetical protein